jgi:hypothetical protein
VLDDKVMGLFVLAGILISLVAIGVMLWQLRKPPDQ